MIKENISWFSIIAIIVYAVIIFIIIYAKILGSQSYEAFLTVTREDGLAEWLTAVFLFGSCLICITGAIKAGRNMNYKWLLVNILLAFMFFFVTGEEISWGQRIFNIRSGEFFMEKNLQGEINFHNLVIGGIKINKLIFSKLMFAGLVFYFILLKPLVRWSALFRKLTINFNIPVPRYHHIILLIVNILLVLQVPPLHLVRESELYEMSVTAVLFLVFLQPAEINKTKKSRID